MSDDPHPPSDDARDTRPDSDDATVPHRHTDAGPGRIGPYRLLERIGQGGMGEVWLAEQEQPVRRRVALKLIKPGMDTEAVLARFEAERQALALMNHPTIARVFDAGSTELGRPYFAMEFVDGEPITDYCDKHRLNTSERLRIFLRVCEGVQHAHQKGIIHRDLKPSNVLVRIQDDRPVPKIIDFGVVKATDQRLTDKTLFTRHGMIVGTPEYMSPEQAEMSGLDVDTRTDVYSLGVILYELLIGALPFDSKKLRTAGFEGMRRIIREEEPSRPSTRVSTATGTSGELARRRRTDPAGLRRALRGDLDWITMKTLDKDRTRRYDSPNELAADIRRHLENEPVLAGPPSVRYRVSKFVVRHRAAVVVSSAILLLLVAATVVSTTLFFRAEAARVEAQRQGYVAALAAAAAALEDNDAVAVRRHLDGAAESLRGWEWHWLYQEADRTLGTVMALPLREGGWCTALGPRGVMAARPSGGNVDPLRVYDTATGEVLHEFPTWECSERHITFSPDGRYIAFAAMGHESVQVWRVSDGYPLLSSEKAFQNFLGFDAHSERMALYRESDSTLVIRSVESGVEQRLRPSWENTSGDFARPGRGDFSPDGRRLAVGSGGGRPVRLYDLEDGRLERELDDVGFVFNLRFSRDGSLLAVLGRGLRVYDTADGGLRLTIELHDELTFGDVVFDERGGQPILVASGADGMLRAWYTTSPLARCETHSGAVSATSLTLTDDGRHFLTSHRDGTVRRWPHYSEWDIRRSRAGGRLGFEVGDVLAMASVGSAPDPRIIGLFDLVDQRLVGALRQYSVTHAHSAIVSDWVLDPSGDRMAVATQSSWNQGRLKVFDVATALGVFQPEAFWGHDPSAVAWSADGKWIALAGTNGFGRLYAAEEPHRWVELRGHAGAVHDVAFAPDSRSVLTCGEDGTLRTWDVETGVQRRSWAAPDSVALTCLTFTGKGRDVLLGTGDGRILVWNRANAAVEREADAHSARVVEIVVAPDGSRIVSGAVDGSVAILEPRALRELIVLRFDGNLSGLGFDADGTKLALGGDHVHVLDVRAESVREKERTDRLEANRVAASWMDELLARGLGWNDVLDRIESSDVHTDVVKSAAIAEAFVRRDSVLAAAWSQERAEAIAKPHIRRQILRDLAVTPESDRWWLDFRVAAGEIMERDDLTPAEREAAAGFALGMRYWNHMFTELRGEGVWTNALIRDALEAREERPGDHVLALFAAEELVKAVPDRPEFRATLDMARQRVVVPPESLEVLRTELGVGDPQTPFSAYTLAIRLWKRGEGERAAVLLRRSLDATIRDAGKHYRGVPERMSLLGSLLHELGRDEEAERCFRDGFALAVEIRHSDVEERRNELAAFLRDTGRSTEADSLSP